jgi:competence protein ComEA
MWKQFIKDYFSFSKKERKGIFILLTIIVTGVLIPLVYPMFSHSRQADNHEFEKQIEALKTKQPDTSNVLRHASGYQKDFKENKLSPSAKAELFDFDPNTASESDWKRLGISDRTVHTIMNYLSKGGHFYKPEDIRKIWGLNKEDADRLMPYIKIAGAKSQNNYQASYQPSNQPVNQPIFPSYKKAESKAIDINRADSLEWVALPGIGPSYSKRIINFRNKLGGFYSIDQVAETFGLPDSTFLKIKPKLILSDTSVKKININKATLEELKAHPYIRYYVANAIIQYRTQHGNFSSLQDLKKIMLITDEIYIKIYHYLSIE